MSARFHLKAATDDLHHELDGRLSRLRLDDPGDYRTFLRIQAATIPPFEDALRRGGLDRLVDGWSQSRRSAALRSDLAKLGEQAPIAVAVGDFNGDAAMLGAAYVVEGSRLGGRMLRRQIGSHFPAAFLGGSDNVGAWQKLVAALDLHLYSKPLLNEASESARCCFSVFLHAVSEAGI